MIVARGSKYKVLSMHRYGLDIHSHPVGDRIPSTIDLDNLSDGRYSLLVTDIGVIVYSKCGICDIYSWNTLKI